jgi:DNA-binding SARP family transcriptional activator
LTLSRADLAFTADEIETLFGQAYGYPLSPGQAEALAVETEGWAIALQMVWQSLQGGAVSSLDAILGQFPTTLETLFDYLAQDVLARQSAEVQAFLLATSVLRQMDGPACDELVEGGGSDEILQALHEGGLFLVSVGKGLYRYHRLFHDFLRAHLGQDPARAKALHRRAAAYFSRTGHPEETIYHLLEAEDYVGAAGLMAEVGPRLVRLGRFDSLASWIGRLPGEVRAGQPGLRLLQGDVQRLRARFEDALAHYLAAEDLYVQAEDRLGRSRALRGQAQVYLDTVRPLKADSLLEEALRLLEPEEHRAETAALLDRLAENKLNLGYPDEARDLHHEANLLRKVDPRDVYLEARAMVRTGRLGRARQLLERRAEEERAAPEGESRAQRFHRETWLLLSLVHALEGDGPAAKRCAEEGIATARRLQSAFVEAVGYMRLGHALQLMESRPWDGAPGRAVEFYQRAIELVRSFQVMRTQAEPLWGLCRAHGYGGDLAAAEEYARRALELVRRAGDEWVQHLVQASMGAGYALAGRSDEARRWLADAAGGFGRVGDPFGQAVAWLWLALDAWWQGEVAPARRYLGDLLPLARQRGYDALLVRPTFLGLKDGQAAVPLLLEARAREIEPAYVQRLLEGLDLAGVAYHPGYSLAVRCLGPFAVWRGQERLDSRAWRREKARQLFQFLLTHRGQRFYREQIVDQLWPHLPPDAAERDFKVALNALNRALEPARPKGASPFFVVRQGSVYGLYPAAGLVVDADDFERLAASENVADLRRAMALYEDDYLPDSLYEDWPAVERQRLQRLYLAAAERLARKEIEAEAWDEAAEICRQILVRDNCREAAYRLLMRIHAARGNRTAVHEVYQRCADTLSSELGIEPALATRALFEKLAGVGV